MQSNYNPMPCPKCGNLLMASGELLLGENPSLQPASGETTSPAVTLTVPVYQCDRCVMRTEFGGESIEAALTFARLPDGTLIDPADPDGKLRF